MALALGSMLFASCANMRPWKGPNLWYDANQTYCCAQHRIPLEEKTIYQRRNPGCILVDSSVHVAFDHFPNALGGNVFADVKDSPSNVYAVPCKVRYCTACEAEFFQLLKSKHLGNGRLADLTL